MILTIVGILMGFAAILVGNALEGGHIESLIQPTAFLIVGGGTLGAVLVGASMQEFVGALKALPLFFKPDPKYDDTVTELLDLANVARKEGVLALDGRLATVENPFLTNFLKKVVDGYDPNVLQDLMDEKMFIDESEHTDISKFYEAFGSFSPTIGIIGAVMGLIHVMSNLSDPSKLGAGIAVAFVATIYGVGLANLIFLPMGTKYKKISKQLMLKNQLCYVAILGIQSGLNPRVIEDQLNNVLGTFGTEEGSGAKAAA